METIALTDSAARDPTVVGAKAAGLAAAASAGLPVLPGRILPSAASADAVARGSDALGAGSEAPAAYLAAMETVVPPDLAVELLPGPTMEEPLVVRSSTLLDDDGRWSGAFTSYVGVGPSELVTAVRGCWASAFTTDALARCRATGAEVGSLRIGVLVQPYLDFEAGGTARLWPDGRVVVSAARRGPAGIVGGRDGLEVAVGAEGRIVEGLDDAAVGAGAIEAAAALARRAAETVDAGVIEWGTTGGDVYLLQVGPTPPRTAVVPRPSRPLAVVVPPPAEAERLARLVATFPGPLGRELVLPWAFGATELPTPSLLSVPASGEALAVARAISGRLAAAVWGVDPPEAFARALQLGHLLRAGHLDEAVDVVGRLRAPDTDEAGRLLGAIAALGDLLVTDGRLPAAAFVWRLTVAEIERSIPGARAPLRRGPDRWEPLMAEVVRARGVLARGQRVHGGVGAGVAHVVGSLAGAFRSAPRIVLVARRPLPQLAPLLWQSAGLITLRGSSGAHLFEVARSLGVPAITGVDLPELETGALLAVDGDEGTVSVLQPPRHDERPPAISLVGSPG